MRRLMPIVAVTLLAGVLLLAAAVPVQAKSYYLRRVEVSAEVLVDGSMHVRETREVVFSGSFHAFDRVIPLRPGTTMDNISVSEKEPYQRSQSESPGTFRAEMVAGEARISWFYDATDVYKTRVFSLEYDILGAVQKHADVAELYWQFIEPKHDWKSLTSLVAVNLPGRIPKGQVRAWAHGPLTGKIHIQEGRVELTCSPLPPNQMVEARIVLPTEAVTSSLRADSASALQGILESEGEWVRQANRERRKVQAGIALPFAALFVGLILWFSLYLRYGREYHADDPPEYLREPLEGWKPHEVGYLWRWGDLGPRDMTAMLMDLVRRGALRLIVEDQARPRRGLPWARAEEEQCVERVSGFTGELAPSERYFIDQVLFHESPEGRVSMSELKESGRRDPRESYQRLRQWKQLAEGESERLPLLDPGSKIATGFGMLIGFLMFGSMFVMMIRFESPWGLVAGFPGFGLIFASFNIMRRTPAAARELHRWQAFRRYLTDFSRLRDQPAPAVTLWEQYLVLAVTLGVAERVIEQFRELYPRMVSEGQATGFMFANWVSPSGSPLTNMSSFSSAFSSFSSSFATATSSFSSSSGSGGGFSGGGGGGGGGGSSGAR